MRAIVVLTCMVLGACARVDTAKPAGLPAMVLSAAPTVISVPQVRYVPIDDYLTVTCKWVRDGALEDMPEVARGRKRCLDFYEANLRQIQAKQGTPLQGEAKP